MDINDFIKNFASQFEDTESIDFTAETHFKELNEWSSLTSLVIIAMVDEEYGVKIKGDDFRNSTTIKDLFEILKSRL